MLSTRRLQTDVRLSPRGILANLKAAGRPSEPERTLRHSSAHLPGVPSGKAPLGAAEKRKGAEVSESRIANLNARKLTVTLLESRPPRAARFISSGAAAAVSLSKATLPPVTWPTMPGFAGSRTILGCSSGPGWKSQATGRDDSD
jgi:hypothetical protein